MESELYSITYKLSYLKKFIGTGAFGLQIKDALLDKFSYRLGIENESDKEEEA